MAYILIVKGMTNLMMRLLKIESIRNKNIFLYFQFNEVLLAASIANTIIILIIIFYN